MARLYGRLIDSTKWTFAEIDAMSVSDVLGLVAHWNEAPPLVECVRLYLGIRPAEELAELIDVGPREVSEEEWKRISEAEEKFAETNFGRRNPLA